MKLKLFILITLVYLLSCSLISTEQRAMHFVEVTRCLIVLVISDRRLDFFI